MIIDVHGHVTAPELLAKYPMPPSLGDIDGMIERKLAAGIGLTVVGSPVGFGTMTRIPGLDNYAQPADKLASFHDWMGETVRAHADHLLAYAYVNPFGTDAELAAAAELVRRPEFVGFIVNTSVRGRFLDDPGADGFFALAAEAGVPIMLHPPAEPVGSPALSHFGLVEQLSRFTDVHLSLATLIMGGRFENDPGLRVIAATGGGALALLADRLDLAHSPRHWAAAGKPALPRRPSSYFSQIWVDTASHSTQALRANVSVFGADHVLFGTDTPPLPHEVADLVKTVTDLGLSTTDTHDILTGNAVRLLGLSEDRLRAAA
ncbi:amidohydrolase family protein [Kutzneria sp. 744]|uniref:amidohydrolase family protein n=1 Tax=Kutzneria sp. (strain 744) TaxID=345341 RepID=UPI0003EED679|nr:amidohydrolase family protein [Kutzneria sp. 744]EWM13565.1 aminocarboxymuconate-semialdehyde decarboxylase [Kutzneria sp. 744]